jgi:hypothetical protein
MIEKTILIPIILSLANQPKETVKNENVIEIPVYKQEISIPISKKKKKENSHVSRKRKKINHKVNVHKNSNYLHIKISIPGKYLKSNQTIKLPPKKIDIEIEK